MDPKRERGRGVLVVSRIHMPEAAAASFRLRAVERALVELGVLVRVLTAKPPKGTPIADDPGVEVLRRPVLRDSSGYVRGYVPYLSFDLPLALRLLAVRRPSVVLVEPPPTTGLVARAILALRRIPYVWYAPDVWSDATEAIGAPVLVRRVVRWMESTAMRGAREVVAINEDVAERARALGGRDVRVVPNGIDTDLFSLDGPVPSAEERARLGVGERYFVYAGTASEWQGAEVFIEALARVRDVDPELQIVFLGQGSAWPALKEAAARLPHSPSGRPSVVFVPSLPPAEAAAWQRGALAALVSIIPGIGYDFAYPTKVLAALGCGTPVVYSGVGGASEDIAAHSLGRAVAHEAGEVAEAMIAALRGPADARERERMRAWVLENRSIRVAGDRVARILLEGGAH